MIEALLSIIGLCAFSYYFGFERGVKETEERWSDAVTRADYLRNLESRNR